MTPDRGGAVSPPTRKVRVPIVHHLFSTLTSLPDRPGRWLSNVMDEADEIWDLIDDDDLGVSLPGGAKGIG